MAEVHTIVPAPGEKEGGGYDHVDGEELLSRGEAPLGEQDLTDPRGRTDPGVRQTRVIFLWLAHLAGSMPLAWLSGKPRALCTKPLRGPFPLALSGASAALPRSASIYAQIGRAHV